MAAKMPGEMDSVFSTAPLTLKYITCFAVYFCNVGNAIVMGILGPALTSLGYTYDAEEKEISKVTTIMGVSVLLGASFAGILFRRVNRQLGAVVFLTIEAIAATLLPNLPSLTYFFVVTAVFGFCGGVFTIAQIAWIIDIWRHESGPFIQAQHFFFALGGLATPLLLGPFLADDKPEKELPTSSTSLSTIKPTAAPNFYVPFAVAGAIVLLGAISQLVLYLIYRHRQQRFQSLSESSSEVQEENNPEMIKKESNSMKRTIILLVLCSFFVGFYQSMEIMTMLFLSKFAQNSEQLRLSEAEASRVTAGFQFAYAAGRGLGIFIIMKVAPYFLLVGNAVFVVLGNVILLTLGGSNESWLWAGSACVGVGFSTAVPAFFAYAERYIFINDSVASVITVWTGIMTSLYPLLISEFIGTFPQILIYCNLANIAVVIVSFTALFRVTYYREMRAKNLKKTEST